MPRLAPSLAGDIPVRPDDADAVTGIGEHNVRLLVKAVLRASG